MGEWTVFDAVDTMGYAAVTTMTMERDVPAVANSGLSVELHPNEFIGALCALNSITGDPGLLISSICTSDPSIENVDI